MDAVAFDEMDLDQYVTQGWDEAGEESWGVADKLHQISQHCWNASNNTELDDANIVPRKRARVPMLLRIVGLWQNNLCEQGQFPFESAKIQQYLKL